MRKPAIMVRDLGKCYRIGRGYATLSGQLTRVARRLWFPRDGAGTSGTESRPDRLWALRHIEFDVCPGEVLGIIGANGSGKSTLLKLVAGITEPTEGFVASRGRIGSLLEVGTGFHPELTGRENVFMNGTLLGMSAREVRRKYDAIVDFSGVEAFMDTPIKRFSSGMFVRLAFSVAIHLEPEILILDEVLAVGDMRFRRKSLERITSFIKGGRTVLFVSHAAEAIRKLCTSAYLLEEGRGRGKTSVEEALHRYVVGDRPGRTVLPMTADDDLTIESFRLVMDGTEVAEVTQGEPVVAEVRFHLHRALEPFRLGIVLCDDFDEIVCRSSIADWEDRDRLGPGQFAARLTIDTGRLLPGSYELKLHASRVGEHSYLSQYDIRRDLRVRQHPGFRQHSPDDRIAGCMMPDRQWAVETL